MKKNSPYSSDCCFYDHTILLWNYFSIRKFLFKENGDSSVAYIKETQSKKMVIGVPIKTSNENGRFYQDVPPLWDRFYRGESSRKDPSSAQ